MSEIIAPTYLPTPEGLQVYVESDYRIPVNEWTSHANVANYTGAFLRMRDDDLAVEQEDGSVLLLHWGSVANLTVEELQYLQLPDACPFTLEITADNALYDPDFEPHCGFIKKGRRVVTRCEGAWLYVGNEQFILVNPLYDIVTAINEFKTPDNQNIESRMLQWGCIAEKLPDDADISSRFLRSISVTVVTGFELMPFVNESGEPDFDPVLGRWQTSVHEGEEEEREFQQALPLARQNSFAKRFRSLSQVKHRYALGASSFVILTQQVEKALIAVHRAQKSSPKERHEFLQNVPGHLRGALDDAGKTTTDLDSVFCDDNLSERVYGVGVWSQKVLPWIATAAEPWLPPEQLGLRIGSEIVSIPAEELPALKDRISTAIECGDTSVSIDSGIEVPANTKTLSAIEELLRSTHPVQAPTETGPSKRGKPETGHPSDQILLITDNLNAIQFKLERRKCTPGISKFSPALRSTLLQHQEEALHWLLQHWEAGNWGALLADDMGLGKTLEALAFLSCLQMHLFNQGLQNRPILVVAPTGLLKNWLDEHDKHLAGHGLGRPLEAHGAGLKKIRIPASSSGNELRSDTALPKLRIDELQQASWVLTTYETLRDYQHSFGRIQWSAGVFDEAQKIKNPGAKVTDAALAMNINFALLMTGTPVENRTSDIWALLDRVEPGKFGPLKQFSKKYESNVEKEDSALRELHGELTRKNGTPELMLRRLKEDHISGLPNKHLHLHPVDMPEIQAHEYEKIINVAWDRDVPMLKTLHHLRSVSLHPEIPSDINDEEYIRGSARLLETFTILQNISELRQKVLIFVEARQMQGFLIGALRRRFQLPDDVMVINGTVPGKVRKERVDVFQNRKGFDVMLLSPRAGGVGLTLTAANHVIHLSRWWNPAVEDQCTDRVFRIGQKKDVHVYFPMAQHPSFGKDSFDLKLDELITRKRERNRRILSPPTANDGDISEMYHSITKGKKYIRRDASGEDINIDLLTPEEFEIWVLNQLVAGGYDTRHTPQSGDFGADGLAYSPPGENLHTILVQCKHLQPSAKCGRAAVEEVIHAISSYKIRGEPKPLVVTTAGSFTKNAREFARRKSVILLDRANLDRLCTMEIVLREQRK